MGKLNANASTFLTANASSFTPASGANPSNATCESYCEENLWTSSMQTRMNNTIASAYQQYNNYYSECGSDYNCSGQYDGYGQCYNDPHCDHQQSNQWQDGWGTSDTYHQGYGQALASYQATNGQSWNDHGSSYTQNHCGWGADQTWAADNSWAACSW